MKQKLNRRQLIHATVVTGAALAVGASAPVPPKPTKEKSAQPVQSGTDPNYPHKPEYCDASWKNPDCPGNPAYWTSCNPHPSTIGAQQSCNHSY